MLPTLHRNDMLRVRRRRQRPPQVILPGAKVHQVRDLPLALGLDVRSQPVDVPRKVIHLVHLLDFHPHRHVPRDARLLRRRGLPPTREVTCKEVLAHVADVLQQVLGRDGTSAPQLALFGGIELRKVLAHQEIQDIHDVALAEPVAPWLGQDGRIQVR